jgi:hypothetical protein
MNVSLTSLQLALHVDPVVQDDLYHSCKSSHILSSQQFVSSLTFQWILFIQFYYVFNRIADDIGLYSDLSHLYTFGCKCLSQRNYTQPHTIVSMSNNRVLYNS